MEPTTLTTSCIMDCPDTCSLEVSVGGGKLRGITGSRDNALTGGFICAKVRQYGKRVYHPDRLLHPMRRAGAKGSSEFVAISWDEAITEITERFGEIGREWGAEAPDSYRASVDTPGGVLMFRSAGAEPVLTVFEADGDVGSRSSGLPVTLPG